MILNLVGTVLNNYENLVNLAEDEGLYVYEDVNFKSSVNALIVDCKIALSKKLGRTSEKRCVLAEEIAHHFINEGDILEDSYQEGKAHRYAIDLILSVESVVNTIIELGEDATITNVAEKLDVTEKFLVESLKLYSRRFYGTFEYNGYIVTFNPLRVWKKGEDGE